MSLITFNWILKQLRNATEPFLMIDFFFPADKVLDSCSFRDEDDDCTYHYTVENPKDKDLEVQVLKKKGKQHALNSGNSSLTTVS